MAETELVQKTCVPCRGGIPPLSAAQVAGLLPQVRGWKATDWDTRIEARFQFTNFWDAPEFVRQVGELAEAEFHHPGSIAFGWGFAAVVPRTKKIEGLHENDFIMAAKINEIANRTAHGGDAAYPQRGRGGC